MQMSAEDAVEELARIDSNWSMHSFKDARPKTIDGKMVLVKGKRAKFFALRGCRCAAACRDRTRVRCTGSGAGRCAISACSKA